jgi:hypothetical protein
VSLAAESGPDIARSLAARLPGLRVRYVSGGTPPAVEILWVL